MTHKPATIVAGVLAAFAAGFFSHTLYQRWNPPSVELSPAPQSTPLLGSETTQAHRVSFLPLSQSATAEEKAPDLPLLVARDVDKIRSLAGRQARIRGRVFRVGHSAKSNTYFLNFGPTREALTAVIFASSVEIFEKNKQAPKNFVNKDVELTGQIKDHPQYGLEVVLESPKQIKILN
jgi:hypothetical protein